MALTQAELAAALDSLGMPVAYGAFVDTPENPAPPPPFIVYQFDRSTDLMADNRNYASIPLFRIEFYTEGKDPVREGRIEALLESLGLTYTKSEVWIDSERLFEVAYETQLI